MEQSLKTNISIPIKDIQFEYLILLFHIMMQMKYISIKKI